MADNRQKLSWPLVLLATFLVGGTSLQLRLHCCAQAHDSQPACAHGERGEHCHYLVSTLRHFMGSAKRGGSDCGQPILPWGIRRGDTEPDGGPASPPHAVRLGLSRGMAAPRLFLILSALLI